MCPDNSIFHAQNYLYPSLYNLVIGDKAKTVVEQILEARIEAEVIF